MNNGCDPAMVPCSQALWDVVGQNGWLQEAEGLCSCFEQVEESECGGADEILVLRLLLISFIYSETQLLYLNRFYSLDFATTAHAPAVRMEIL